MQKATSRVPARSDAAVSGPSAARSARTADRPPPRPQWQGLFVEPPPWPEDEEDD